MAPPIGVMSHRDVWAAPINLLALDPFKEYETDEATNITYIRTDESYGLHDLQALRIADLLWVVEDLPTRFRLVRWICAALHLAHAGKTVILKARRALLLIRLVEQVGTLFEDGSSEWDWECIRHQFIASDELANRPLSWFKDIDPVVLDESRVRGVRLDRIRTLVARRMFRATEDPKWQAPEGTSSAYLIPTLVGLDWSAGNMDVDVALNLHFQLAQVFAKQLMPYYTAFPMSLPVKLVDYGFERLLTATTRNRKGTLLSSTLTPSEYKAETQPMSSRPWVTVALTNSSAREVGVKCLSLVMGDGLSARYLRVLRSMLDDDGITKMICEKLIALKIRAWVRGDYHYDTAVFVPVVAIEDLSVDCVDAVIAKLFPDADLHPWGYVQSEWEGFDHRMPDSRQPKAIQEALVDGSIEELEQQMMSRASLVQYALSAILLGVMAEDLRSLEQVEEKVAPVAEDLVGPLYDQVTARECILGGDLAERHRVLIGEAARLSLPEPTATELEALGTFRLATPISDKTIPIDTADVDFLWINDDSVAKFYDAVSTGGKPSSTDSDYLLISNEGLTMKELADEVPSVPTAAAVSLRVDMLVDVGLCKATWDPNLREASTRRIIESTEATRDRDFASLPMADNGARIADAPARGPFDRTLTVAW